MAYGQYIRPSEYDDIQDKIVYVTKIPEGVNSRDIAGIFSSFGKIKFCKLKLDGQHNSLDKALVIYDDPKSAVKAI